MAENKYRKARTEMASKGRGGDTVLGHLSRGEMVIPNQLLDLDDGAFRKIVEGVMKEYGINPKEFTVGDSANKTNPETGLPEFGFFKKIFKAAKKVVKSVISTVKSVVGAVTGAKPTTSTAAEAPSTAAAPTQLEEEDAAKKKSELLRRKRRGRRGLRIDGNNSLGGAADGTGIGTGGSSGGSSVNVPKG